MQLPGWAARTANSAQATLTFHSTQLCCSLLWAHKLVLKFCLLRYCGPASPKSDWGEFSKAHVALGTHLGPALPCLSELLLVFSCLGKCVKRALPSGNLLAEEGSSQAWEPPGSYQLPSSPSLCHVIGVGVRKGPIEEIFKS